MSKELTLKEKLELKGGYDWPRFVYTKAASSRFYVYDTKELKVLASGDTFWSDESHCKNVQTLLENWDVEDDDEVDKSEFLAWARGNLDSVSYEAIAKKLSEEPDPLDKESRYSVVSETFYYVLGPLGDKKSPPLGSFEEAQKEKVEFEFKDKVKKIAKKTGLMPSTVAKVIKAL